MKRATDLSHGGTTAKGYICTIDVRLIDDYCRRIIKAGGLIEMDKLLIPGAGWLVYGRDTENNIFGMIESDSK